MNTERLSLIDWLRERYENCLRIGRSKVGKDADAWAEDAAYFREAIDKLEAVERYWRSA